MREHEEHDRVREHYHGTKRIVTIDPATGWYFRRTNGRWDRYGPYRAVSPALIMKEFERDTGIRAQIGDRVFFENELVEFVEDSPARTVAEGRRAEEVMQEMQHGNGNGFL